MLAKRPAQKKLEKFVYEKTRAVFEEARVEKELEESLHKVQGGIERRMKALQEKMLLHRRGGLF